MSDSWIMGALAAQDAYNPEEGHFQTGIRATPWFSEFKQKYGEEPNLNDPDYDYRAAWRSGARPEVRDPGDQLLHWPSQFKGEHHPNRYVDGVDTRSGDDVGVYRGMPRLDPGIRRAPGDTAMRPAAETFGQVVGDLVIPQDPLDYAAMFALGPAGKMVGKGARAGALAMGGVLGLSDEAEASKLKAIRQGIKAYHSSPHDFEKFDASKIGTGEGAQVYGHGLYFAENPKVSGQGGQYWNAFMNRFPPEELAAATRLQQAKFDREKALEAAQHALEGTRRRAQGSPGDFHRRAAEELEQQVKLLASGQPVGPRTYEVNIRADPAQMLDWDKPLAAQPRSVQDIAAEAIKNPGRGAGFLADPSDFAPISGGNLYHALKAQKGDMVRAADVFREAGIPGIKYLDQGSRRGPVTGMSISQIEGRLAQARDDLARGFGDPQRMADMVAAYERELARHNRTSNYVVFDPSIVDIMKKYGIAGAAAPMGALAAIDEYR